MAFKPNGNSRSNNQVDDSWKSQGFVNIYLTAADGSRGRKIGAIALKESKAFEAALLTRLSSGTAEEQAASLLAMKAAIQLDFQRTDKEVPAAVLGF